MSLPSRFYTQLRSQGRRLTPQRRAIIEALQENGSHPTAEQIYARVHPLMPELSPATVYNTLHKLVEIGMLMEIDVGLGERHYDVNTTIHAHLVCLACGRVTDVADDYEVPALTKKHARGFRVMDCNVTFRGYCPACASLHKNRGRTRIG